MIHIFLAHASEDKKAVIDLYQRLKERGFKPWLDKVDLLPGQSWRAEIPKAIKNSDIFIACLSQRSVEKQGYIQREFKMALNAMADRPPGQIFLIPVRLDNCQVPELRQEEYGINLADYQWVNLFEPAGFERLVEGIEAGFADVQLPKHHTDRFPLPNPAKNFIQKIGRQKHWNRLKMASLLIIPVIFLDFLFHNRYIKQHYDNLNRNDVDTEQRSVLSLTKDCASNFGRQTWYLTERFTNQYCRSLRGQQFKGLRNANLSYVDLRYAKFRGISPHTTNFSNADLSNADLSYTDLSYADFSNANLSNASLIDADLHPVNFSNADLSNADLSVADLIATDLNNADLSNANLNNTIFLATNLDKTQGLTQEQLEKIENSPFICGSLLPEHIEIERGQDRDCDQIARLLLKRYPGAHNDDLETAETWVKDCSLDKLCLPD